MKATATKRDERDTAWDAKGVQVRLSHVVWPENGEKGGAYIQVRRGSGPGGAIIAVEVVSCRRVSVPTSDSVRVRVRNQDRGVPPPVINRRPPPSEPDKRILCTSV